MQIFILDVDPKRAATQLCDKHICNQNRENAQLASTVFRKLTPNGDAEAEKLGLYKSTHVNHPCVTWLEKSSANFTWFLEHARATHDEYMRRYPKPDQEEWVGHDSWKITQTVWDNVFMMQFPDDQLTVPCVAIKHASFRPLDGQEKVWDWEDVVDAYHRYYVFEKRGFAKWTTPSKNGKRRMKAQAPQWYSEGQAYWDRVAAQHTSTWKRRKT